MEQGIAALEKYLDKEEKSAQTVIDKVMAELHDESREGWTQAGNILWALRYPDSFIGAAVYLRRYSQIRQMIQIYRLVEQEHAAGEETERVKNWKQVYGDEVSEAKFIEGLDAGFMRQLIQKTNRASQGLRDIGSSEIEGAADVEFLSRWLDNKPWRWF